LVGEIECSLDITINFLFFEKITIKKL